MAKGKYISWLPLYSIQAWGRFYGPYPFGYEYSGFPGVYGYSIFQRRRTTHGVICIKEKYYRPTNPRSDLQQGYRTIFADAVSSWQNLSAEEKQSFNTLRYPTQMSGYNRFIGYYLKSHSVSYKDHLLTEYGYHILKEDDWKIELE